VSAVAAGPDSQVLSKQRTAKSIADAASDSVSGTLGQVGGEAVQDPQQRPDEQQ